MVPRTNVPQTGRRGVSDVSLRVSASRVSGKYVLEGFMPLLRPPGIRRPFRRTGAEEAPTKVDALLQGTTSDARLPRDEPRQRTRQWQAQRSEYRQADESPRDDEPPRASSVVAFVMPPMNPFVVMSRRLLLKPKTSKYFLE
jgi:hypothetical protein